MRHLLTILSFMLLSGGADGQTCCSGGVPLSSNIGFNSSGKGAIQLALSFDQNNLQTLYNENNILEFNNRERITRSFLGRVGYGVTERFSVEALLPYINQQRNITQNNGEVNNETSKGLGDVVVLTKYDLIKSISNTFNIGIGVKLSSGSTSETNSMGLLLVNDMQPGSGAYDLIGRVSWFHNLSARPSMSMYLNSVVSIKGTDDSYLGSEQYTFGKDWQVIGGISDHIIIGQYAYYPSLGFRFRAAARDKVNQNALENTGGKWMFAKAGFGMDVYKNHRLAISYEIPVYTHVDGTQLSPDHIINITYSTHIIKETNPTTTLK